LIVSLTNAHQPPGQSHSMGRLSLKVVPGSSRDEVVGWLGDSLTVKVEALPEKGRANQAVVALLADRLGIQASGIAVVSGHGSPAKVVAVEGLDDAVHRGLGLRPRGHAHPDEQREPPCLVVVEPILRRSDHGSLLLKAWPL